MGDKYYPLHVHTTTGSVGDSILRVSDYVKKGKEYGLDALAITDHGSLASIYMFIDACKEEGIKPIIGMEAYVCEDNQKKDKNDARTTHLILLARNAEGLRNLFSIHNNAAVDGFYKLPRTDFSHLKEFGKGIIGMSACIGGDIPQAILEGDEEKCLNLIQTFKNCFDEFYLEIQPGKFEDQLVVNDALVALGELTDTPIVVTNDIHYLDAEDYRVHDLHVRLRRKKQIESNGELLYPDTCYWFMDKNTLKKNVHLSYYLTEDILEEAISNAESIASKCSCEFSSQIYMPKFHTELGQSEEEAIYERCLTRLEEIKENLPNPQLYIDRLNYELEVIRDKGFYGYFLVVQDYVNAARDMNIPVGPARGSAAGSLVNFLLGISQVDPIRYGLMFERFMDPHREAIPDIDVDFGTLPGTNLGRNSLFDYVVDKYGYDHCARVNTFQYRKARGAVRDCARVLGYDLEIGDAIAKLIPQVYYGDDDEKVTDMKVEEALEVVPELKEQYELYPDIFDMAQKLEGLPSKVSIHAAGCIVSPVPLQDKMPMRRPDSDTGNVLISTLDLDSAEKNFVKFDYLGVVTLSVIKGASIDSGFEFDYQNEDLYRDDAVWDMIGSRNTDGLFQLGSKTYKDRMPRLKPHSIEELAACLALIRGPAISAKTDQTYMEILEGKREVELIHPLYDQITADTNGILIYQEQIMQLAVAFDMDLTTGYRIVKLSAKKKMDKLQKYRKEFVTNALERKCDENTANRIFDMVVDSGKYSFNLSHAVSYAMLSYCSAYMKVHYPMEYMSNLLTDIFERGKKDTYRTTLDDCRRMGIQFLPADINESEWKFTIEDSKIRIGLCAIKGLGELAVKYLQDFKPIISLEDLISRVACSSFNKKAQNIAIFSGLLDDISDGKTRHELYEQRVDIVNQGKTGKQQEECSDIISISKDMKIDTNASYDELEELFCVVQFIHDPANNLKAFGWNEIKKGRSFETDAFVRRIKKIKTKTNQQMAFVSLATGDGTIDATVFPNAYNEMKKNLKKGLLCHIAARKEDTDKCILNSIEDITA